MSVRMQIKNVRLSYPNLFEPRVESDTGRKTYGCNLIIDKDHPQLPAIKSAIKEVLGEWKDDKARKKVVLCLRDGEEKEDDDGYGDGVVFFAANRNAAKQGRPTIVDADRSPLVEEDGRPYAGCYVNAIVEFYAYKPRESNRQHRVCACLEGLQFFRDGEAFSGGRRASADDFDDVTGEAGAEFDALEDEDEVASVLD